MEQFLKRYKWKILGVTLGALAGFLYWYFIGCVSGTCPIQSHWQSSMLYGGLIGYLVPKSPKKKKENSTSEEVKQ